MFLTRRVLCSTFQRRCFSSNQPLIANTIDKDGISTISLNKAPVNTLNLEMIQQLSDVIKTTEMSAKGIVLTSSLTKVFCAGLDIMEMYQPERKKAEVFWSTFQDLWISLYGCKIPTVAAINGQR